MKFSSLIGHGTAFLKARLFKRPTPLFVGWDITNRCNCDCRYCGISKTWPAEMDTETIHQIISALAELGTKRIHFGGGECLIRDDLGSIIDLCRNYGIYVTLITNGILFKKRLSWIKNSDMVKISFDGPEEVHDWLRNRKGSFREVMEAVELCKKYSINIAFNTTLTKFNIEHTDFILNTADKLDVPVKFQPANLMLNGNKDIEYLIDCSDNFKNAVKKIKISKKNGNRNIVNSDTGLDYLIDENNTRKKMKCCAGLLLLRMDPAGNIYRCSGTIDKLYQIDRKHELKEDISQVMKNMPVKVCSDCLCTASLELNSMYSLKFNSFAELWRYF